MRRRRRRSAPSAIVEYSVPEALGGDAALARLRGRLHERGLRLMVDFVGNHVAVDHPWTLERPHLFVQARPAPLPTPCQ